MWQQDTKHIIKRITIILLLATSIITMFFSITQKAEADIIYIENSGDDGWVQGKNSDYDTAHSIGIYADSVGSVFHVGQEYSDITGDYTIFRTFLKFNTSDILSDTVISSAKVELYCYSDSSAHDFVFRLQKWTNDVPITTGDYNEFDGINYDDGLMNSSIFGVSWNNITISNFDLITKEGYTKICIRSDKDIAETVPTDSEYFSFRSYDYNGGSKKSRLYVIYTVIEPTVITQDADNMDHDSAKLHGNLTNTGGQYADARGFEWDLDSGSPYAYNWTTSGSFGKGTFEHTITDLIPHTTYYYRAMAHNDAGWGYGEEKNFTTQWQPQEDYVDNNDSDVDTSDDIGTHLNFTAQQYSDGICDTLTEANTGGDGQSYNVKDDFDNENYIAHKNNLTIENSYVRLADDPFEQWLDRFTHDLVDGRNHKSTFHTSPQVFWNNQTESWTELLLVNKTDSPNPHYLIRNAHISARIGISKEWEKEGVLYYDPDMKKGQICAEFWTVQTKIGTEWINLISDFHSHTIFYNQTFINITGIFKVLHLERHVGWMQISYILEPASYLKHEVVCKNILPSNRNLRLVMSLVGIAGRKVIHRLGETEVTLTEQQIRSHWLRFVNSSNPQYQFLEERLDSLGHFVINETTEEPVWINDFLKGIRLKLVDYKGKILVRCDIVIGNYLLGENEILYIDPDSSTYYSAAGGDDGDAYGLNTDYNTAHSTCSSSSDSYQYVRIGQRKLSIYYYVYRSFFKIDTSSLSESAEIISAHFDLYGLYDYSDRDTAIRLLKWAGDTPITCADYTQSSGLYDDGSFDTSSFTTSGYNEITISDFDLIIKGGYTKICVRTARDYLIAIPSGEEHVYVRTYEKGVAYRPKLYVEWGEKPTYYSTGHFYSENMLDGTLVATIDTFNYTATVVASTTLHILFSQDNTTWKNSTNGIVWEALTTGTNNSISLSTLAWTTAFFYYRIGFNNTDDSTPYLNQTITIYTEPIPNYEIDLEIQWVNVNYTRSSEELCLYIGATGTEDLKVYIWNITGSSWILLTNDLTASTWNNWTITDYLDNETFTLRFLGGNETADSQTQDSWEICASLIHTWVAIAQWNLVETWYGTIMTRAWIKIELWYGILTPIELILHQIGLLGVTALMFTLLYEIKKEIICCIIAAGLWIDFALVWLLLSPSLYVVSLLFSGIGIFYMLRTILYFLNRLDRS